MTLLISGWTTDSALLNISETVNYPSNVKGGKGFFNLYMPDVKLFVLEY